MLSSKVREIQRKNKFSTPEVLYHDIWEAINATVGKVLHICFSFGNTNLSATAKGYLHTTGTTVILSQDVLKNILKLETSGRGVIIANHPADNFSDTFPLLAQFSNEILKKTIFYTVSQTHKMNSNEFPEYTFRKATLRTRGETKELTKNIQKDIEMIEKKGGYIFIIPSGGGSEEKDFRAIFQRLVKGLSSETPVIAHHISHDRNQGYVDIAKSLILKNATQTHISNVMTNIGDWKGKTGEEMRQYYHSLFDEKKQLF